MQTVLRRSRRKSRRKKRKSMSWNKSIPIRWRTSKKPI